MNIPLFDQTKADPKIQTFEAEAVRLSNELRTKPAKTFIDIDGIRIDIPAKRGFDCETADFMTMVNWLADTRIKKSESLIAFVYRILSVRFSTEYEQHKDQIKARYKLEYEMIQSKSKNDVSWFGEVGYGNKVRLDGSLTNHRAVTKQFKNERVRTVSK